MHHVPGYLSAGGGPGILESGLVAIDGNMAFCTAKLPVKICCFGGNLAVFSLKRLAVSFTTAKASGRISFNISSIFCPGLSLVCPLPGTPCIFAYQIIEWQLFGTPVCFFNLGINVFQVFFDAGAEFSRFMAQLIVAETFKTGNAG
jgi:hypothetical protein